MGNAVAANTSCAACHCELTRKSTEMAVSHIDHGVYPHAHHGKTYQEEADAQYLDGPPEVEKAQNVVKNFVRCLIKGLPVSLLSVHGGTADCLAFLDRRLTQLELQRTDKVDAKRRQVNLEEIAEVVVGEYGGQDFNLPTDALSVTLVLDSGQAIGFRFDNDEDRDTFALCLSMFIDGRRLDISKNIGQGPKPLHKV
mmetsp:Transcript_94775/g.271878  ORF Transcript_94775/g.271878 Transcript_94775/m.271878 type:complete len:197 (-) Transcript_94775:68-658(-)